MNAALRQLLLGAQPGLAQAQALAARMTVAPSASVKRAYASFYGATTSILAKLDALYIFAAPSQQAALLNLVGPTLNLTVSGGMNFAPFFGFGTDSTGYLDTGVAASALTKFTQNDASVGFYIGRIQSEASQTGFLAGLSGSGATIRLNAQGGPTPFGRINDAAELAATTDGTDSGLWSIRRTGATARALLRGNTTFGSDAQASTVRSGQDIVFFKDNVTFASSSLESWCAFMGGSLSDSDLVTLAAAVSAFKTAVTPIPTSPAVSTATFSTQTAIPDGQGSTVGKGFTCTGLDRDANLSWWFGNYGRTSDQAPLTNTPSLVNVSADFSTKLAELDLSAITTTEGPQGVAYDIVAGSVWWTGNDQNVVRQVNKTTGVQISSLSMGYFCNALAYDSIRDCLIVGRRSNESLPNIVEWRDKTTGKLLRWITGANNADHFWFDPSKGAAGQLWMSYGNNGVDGQVDVLDIDSRQIVQTFTLTGSLAIEGIYRTGSTLIVANDLFYHGQGTVNCVRSYALS